MDMVVGVLRGRALWAAEFITTFAVFVPMVLLVWAVGRISSVVSILAP